jgi:hypothetical protein
MGEALSALRVAAGRPLSIGALWLTALAGGFLAVIGLHYIGTSWNRYSRTIAEQNSSTPESTMAAINAALVLGDSTKAARVAGPLTSKDAAGRVWLLYPASLTRAEAEALAGKLGGALASQAPEREVAELLDKAPAGEGLWLANGQTLTRQAAGWKTGPDGEALKAAALIVMEPRTPANARP